MTPCERSLALGPERDRVSIKLKRPLATREYPREFLEEIRTHGRPIRKSRAAEIWGDMLARLAIDHRDEARVKAMIATTRGLKPSRGPRVVEIGDRFA